MSPSISVVIPAFGNWAHVLRAVRSVAGPPPRPGTEVVVVDDASPERPPRELVRTPGVRVVRRAVNGGFAAAVNSGLEATSNDVIAIVNSDLQVSASDLDVLASEAVERGRVIVGPRTTDPGGSLLPTARRWPTTRRLLAEFFVPLRLLPSLDVRLRDIDLRALGSEEPSSVDWVVGSCLVLSRTVADDLGPLDERFHMTSEEIDWQRRAMDRNVDRLYLPRVEVVHDVAHGDVARATGDERFSWLWTARFRYVRKHSGAAAVILLRIGMVACFTVMLPFWSSVWLLEPPRRQQVVDQIRRHWRALWLRQ